MDVRHTRVRMVKADSLIPILATHRLVLASRSPRRRELMELLGIPFSVAPDLHVSEPEPPEIPATALPEFLARHKAEAYSRIMQPGQLLLTADTLVIADDHSLGKPKDAAEAERMLKKLSGARHQVVTGVCLRDDAGRCKSFSAATTVEFASLSDEEITFYVQHFRPFDKAGAYGIQEWIGAVGIRGIEGSFYNVMGLPVHRLWTELKTF